MKTVDLYNTHHMHSLGSTKIQLQNLKAVEDVNYRFILDGFLLDLYNEVRNKN